MGRITAIEQRIAPLKKELTNHKLYKTLSTIDDVKIFMEKHVYAVWDFMSLLKALQYHLTCTTVPWKPAKNAKTARFINEIVLGEETDLNEIGIPISHYEMYLAAMKEVNADTLTIEHLLNSITSIDDVNEKLAHANLKPAEREFLTFTFEVIASNKAHKIASAFTFGREDVIPDMFIEIVNQSKGGKKDFPKLTYYLERHIELDGDEHGPLSLEMIKELCLNDEQKWQEVSDVAVMALEKRIRLWDEISEEIHQKHIITPELIH